jgi:predicted HTH domain antitoxin
VRVRIVSFDGPGLIVKARRARFTIAYGEILTAERLRTRRELRLHTRMGDDVRIARGSASSVEDELRRRGVRIVDCWGAIIAPTLLGFEEELAREPVRMRQSSDSA